MKHAISKQVPSGSRAKQALYCLLLLLCHETTTGRSDDRASPLRLSTLQLFINGFESLGDRVSGEDV